MQSNGEEGPFSKKELDEQMAIQNKIKGAQRPKIPTQSLAELSVEELKSLLEQDKSAYDLQRQNHGALSKKLEALTDTEQKITNGYNKQVAVLEAG